jgi:hypothetical protein
MAQYEKKRSARRSTPRHPITMASTAEPPHAMCTGRDLVARVARARLPYAKRLVSGDLLGACLDVCVRAVPAYGVRGCGVGARREPWQRHGYEEAVSDTAVGRRTLVESPLPRRRRV